jgi:hypothetical protein
MSKSQDYTFQALKKVRQRTPFDWKGLDSDNGPEFINSILYKYCSKERLEFTRSRPLRKNDNAYIEQKNWTHVRKVFGYLRYDTGEELALMNDLYRNELRLYKNFFQPVMKLKSKERLYLSLNPAELKRAIDAKLDKLYRAYERKSRSGQVDPSKKVVPHSEPDNY